MIEKLYGYSITDEKTVEKFIDDDNCTVGHVILPMGEELPAHSTDSNVYLFILRGEVVLSLDDEAPKTFGPGSVVNVPYNTLMGIKNPSEKEVMEFFAFKSPNPKYYKVT